MSPADHITVNGYQQIRYHKEEITPSEMIEKSRSYYIQANRRRTIRKFSSQPIPKEVIENIIKTAGTAPSGANMQPWKFCAISNPALKKEIRIAAEIEEKKNYSGRMSDQWLKDLGPLATDMNKPFLEDAPWLIVAFKESYGKNNDGTKRRHYYVNESVGLACGMLISAIHQAGLVTLTHTPSPMDFLSKILHRPNHERAYLLLPIGLPENPCYVPNIHRKKLDEIAVFHE